MLEERFDESDSFPPPSLSTFTLSALASPFIPSSLHLLSPETEEEEEEEELLKLSRLPFLLRLNFLKKYELNSAESRDDDNG